jgi:hypothetical protein
VHKARNVKEPPSRRTARLRRSHDARRLDDEHPGAAASVREGLVETLTVIKLGLPQSFARTFATTNPIENRALDLPQREALAQRHDDPSLVLRGDDRGAIALPPRQV